MTSLENLWQRLQRPVTADAAGSENSNNSNSTLHPLQIFICNTSAAASNKSSAFVGAILAALQNTSELLFQHQQQLQEDNGSSSSSSSSSTPSHVKRSLLHQRQQHREVVSAAASQWAKARRSFGVGFESVALLLPVMQTKRKKETGEGTGEASNSSTSASSPAHLLLATQELRVDIHVVDFANLLESAAAAANAKPIYSSNGGFNTLFMLCVDGEEPAENMAATVDAWRSALATVTKHGNPAAAATATTSSTSNLPVVAAALKESLASQLPVCDAESLAITLCSPEKRFPVHVASSSLPSSSSSFLSMFVRLVSTGNTMSTIPADGGNSNEQHASQQLQLLHQQLVRRLAMESESGFAQVALPCMMATSGAGAVAAGIALSSSSQTAPARSAILDALGALTILLSSSSNNNNNSHENESELSSALFSAIVERGASPSSSSCCWSPFPGIDTIGRLSLPAARSASVDAFLHSVSSAQKEHGQKMRKKLEAAAALAASPSCAAVPPQLLHGKVLESISVAQAAERRSKMAASASARGTSQQEQQQQQQQDDAPEWDDFG